MRALAKLLRLALTACMHSIDPVARIMQCQAGCVLETLDNTLAEHDLMMPLDLGAKGRSVRHCTCMHVVEP